MQALHRHTHTQTPIVWTNTYTHFTHGTQTYTHTHHPFSAAIPSCFSCLACCTAHTYIHTHIHGHIPSQQQSPPASPASPAGTAHTNTHTHTWTHTFSAAIASCFSSLACWNSLLSTWCTGLLASPINGITAFLKYECASPRPKTLPGKRREGTLASKPTVARGELSSRTGVEPKEYESSMPCVPVMPSSHVSCKMPVCERV
jgi:hypothetical protein